MRRFCRYLGIVYAKNHVICKYGRLKFWSWYACAFTFVANICSSWNSSPFYVVFCNFEWINDFLEKLLGQWFLMCGYALPGILETLSVGPQGQNFVQIILECYLSFSFLLFYEHAVEISRGYVRYHNRLWLHTFSIMS